MAYFLELTEEDAHYWSRELSFENTNSRMLGVAGGLPWVSVVLKKIIIINRNNNKSGTTR